MRLKQPREKGDDSEESENVDEKGSVIREEKDEMNESEYQEGSEETKGIRVEPEAN